MQDSSLFSAIIPIGCLLVAVVLHELSHALIAFRLGDPTAKQLGRITLNPIKHIDPFMTIILPAMLVLLHSPVVFGGAKPVPVNPLYFKNPRKGMAIVAAAGPLCNILLAAIGYGMLFLLASLGMFGSELSGFQSVILAVFGQWILINIILALFNLFPVPPLDGGRIMTGILPANLAREYAKLERYGLFIVFGMLYLGVIDSYLMAVITFVLKLLGAVDGIG